MSVVSTNYLVPVSGIDKVHLGAATAILPVDGSDIATKAYVDSAILASENGGSSTGVVSLQSVTVTGDTASTSKTTGAIILAGGIGVSRDSTFGKITADSVVVGGTVGVTGDSTFGKINASTVAVSGSITVPTPTANGQATTKAYVDSAIASVTSTPYIVSTVLAGLTPPSRVTAPTIPSRLSRFANDRAEILLNGFVIASDTVTADSFTIGPIPLAYRPSNSVFHVTSCLVHDPSSGSNVPADYITSVIYELKTDGTMVIQSFGGTNNPFPAGKTFGFYPTIIPYMISAVVLV